MLTSAAALRFCATSPAAIVLTVWPSGTGHTDLVRDWLSDANVRILYEAPVELNTEISELLTVMALYDGEEWLESNCWYSEQPLPSGPPEGPWAGAKWKRALCYRNQDDRRPHAFVADISGASSSLWSGKYTIRRKLASLSGNPGNSCIHLTDEQGETVLSGGRRTAGGMGCDDSYAYACARALLHPASLTWLNSGAGGLAEKDLGGASFRQAWRRYTGWLHEPVDADAEDQSFPPAPETFLP